MKGDCLSVELYDSSGRSLRAELGLSSDSGNEAAATPTILDDSTADECLLSTPSEVLNKTGEKPLRSCVKSILFLHLYSAIFLAKRSNVLNLIVRFFSFEDDLLIRYDFVIGTFLV